MVDLKKTVAYLPRNILQKNSTYFLSIILLSLEFHQLFSSQLLIFLNNFRFPRFRI